ncbi:uncharacterized protein LOC143038601 isoform X2 [Oratosquilla oratoria]|uniref:uncharacterized protein LOC143038601 isoform X2 n=1 Tax=Oratosquilla oratoria TaxID=337810 RepID=UPI003F767B80
MSSKDEKVTLRDDGEGGGGRSSSDGGVEGGGVDVRLDGDIEEPNLDSGVDPSISVDNADVGVEQSRLQMENTKLEDGVETFTDASSGKLDEVDSERVDAVTGERLSNIDDTRLSEVDGERLDSSGGDVGGEAQAITITIMDPGSLDPSALDPGTLSGALVTTVEAQSEDATGFMVNEDGTIVVQGDEGLHAVNDVSIALINSASDNTVTSLNQVPDSERTSSIIKADNSSLSKRRDALRKDFVSVSAAEEEEEDDDEEIGRHCFICNVDLPLENPDDSISVFKTQTTSSSRKVSVILSSLVGQTLTARKAHSDIMCRRCFSLLDRVDTLEVEIKSSKEEIVTKFQNTIAMYGGRARKRKPTAAVRRDFVFPKVEPEDDYEAKELDMDDNFEPTVDDLMQEEADERDDDNLVDVNTAEGDDTEWEPQTKRPRVKKEPVDIADPNAPPKRKRGRPRKGTTSVKSKDKEATETKEATKDLHGRGRGSIAALLERLPSLLQYVSVGEEGVFTCVSCQRRLPSERAMSSHRCEYECSECGHEFGTVVALAGHPCIETGGGDAEEGEKEAEGEEEEEVVCDLCGLTVDTKDLRHHRNEHIAYSVGLYEYAMLKRGSPVSLADMVDSAPRTRVPGRPRRQQPCWKCGLVFEGVKDLLRHERQVHPELFVHACRLCQETFKYVQDLKTHLLCHFFGKFECSHCSIKFTLKRSFLKHMLEDHPGVFLLKCDMCDFSCGDYSEYRKHRREPHEGAGTEVKVCPDCGETLPLQEAPEHEEEHLMEREPVPVDRKPVEAVVEAEIANLKRRRRRRGKGQWKCFLCNLNFSSAGALSRHNHAVHPDRYRHACTTCGKKFKGFRALEIHNEGHVSGACWCPICKMRFRNREHVDDHIKRSHADTNLILCEYCSRHFDSYRKYTYHCRMRHAQLLEDRVVVSCPDCGEQFDSRELLKRHAQANHAGDKKETREQCPICRKSYVHLGVHMNLHTKAVQYECNHCSEVFYQRSSLLAHVRQRHDPSARTHVCSYCSKAFTRATSLRIHVDQVHLLKRPYCCEYCGKSYKNRSALTSHLKTHTAADGELACPSCDRHFHKLSHLQTHMTRTHQTLTLELEESIAGVSEVLQAEIGGGEGGVVDGAGVEVHLVASSSRLEACPGEDEEEEGRELSGGSRGPGATLVVDNPHSGNAGANAIDVSGAGLGVGHARTMAIGGGDTEGSGTGGAMSALVPEEISVTESEMITVVEELGNLMYQDSNSENVYIIMEES